jgi:two-component system CheB/CheR fusion protein
MVRSAHSRSAQRDRPRRRSLIAAESNRRIRSPGLNCRPLSLAPTIVDEADWPAIEEILSLLSARAGVAFEQYRKGTLVRRIRQRMRLRRLASLADYARDLRTDAAELDALFDYVLIGITAFFRDPEAWEELRAHAIADIVQRRSPAQPIRAWVPGCATGEEPYSLGMLLLEAVEATRASIPIKIFATDIDAKALEVARAGRYPHRLLASVSAQRVRRFFVREDDEYARVCNELRRCVIFAAQDVTNDPPYSHLDLISCRNLLIYLERDAQGRVIQLFHFALREGGYLFLGCAEGVARRSELFEAVCAKWRIYRRIVAGR